MPSDCVLLLAPVAACFRHSFSTTIVSFWLPYTAAPVAATPMAASSPKPTVHGEQVGVLEPPLRHADQNYRVVAERFHSCKSIAVVRSTLTAGPMSNDGSPSPILRKMPRHRPSTHSVASLRTSRTTVGMPPVEGLALAIASTPPVSWNADQRHCQHPVDAPPNSEKPTELQSAHLPLRGRRLSL